ncbi:hypothetical protein AN1V17_34730 [Vallitalea sediminicola]
MNNKKILALLLSTLLIMGTFVGCGNKAEESSNTEDKKVEGTKDDDSGEEEAQEKGSGLSGEVVYWSMWSENEPQAKILKGAVERFEEANPDVKVEVQWQGRGVRDLVIPAIEGGQKLDIFDSDPVGMYTSLGESLLNLDELYSSPSISDPSKTLAETILPSLVKWDKSLADGVELSGHFSVPYAPYAVAWFYNKDHFEKAGIKSVPKTWGELDAACASLKEAGFKPITVDDAYYSMMFSYYLDRAITNDEVAKLVSDKTGESWDDPLVVQAIKAFEDFHSKGYFAPEIETNKFPAGQQQVALDEATMYFNGTWLPAEVSATTGPDFNWGQFTFPTVPNGKGKITDLTFGGQAFLANAKTDNKEATFELLKYFVDTETQQAFADAGLTACTVGTKWPESIADAQAIVSGADKNINWGANLSGDFAEAIVVPEMVNVMIGKSTAEEFIEKMKKEAKIYAK